MKVFKVYDDDEWEQIVGEGQLKEFVISQVWNCPDDYLKENLEYTLDSTQVDKVLELSDMIQKCNDENYPTLSLEDIKLLLSARCFDLEEIELY